MPDKSISDTPRRKTYFVKRVSFSISNFDISTPSPFFNICCKQVKVSTERTATLKWGRGGGGGYRQKRCFLKLRKATDKKRLFCSNVSTLLSMTVGQKAYMGDLLSYFKLIISWHVIEETTSLFHVKCLVSQL